MNNPNVPKQPDSGCSVIPAFESVHDGVKSKYSSPL